MVQHFDVLHETGGKQTCALCSKHVHCFEQFFTIKQILSEHLRSGAFLESLHSILKELQASDILIIMAEPLKDHVCGEGDKGVS